MGAQRAILLRSACQRALYSCRLGFVSSSPAPFPMTSLQACLLEVSAKQAVLSNHLAPAGKCDNKCPEGLKNCHDNCNENYVSCQLNIGGVIGEICLLLGPVQTPHGPIVWPGDSCGTDFNADLCLHNKHWCALGCRSKCVGPYPPQIQPPPLGPPHHKALPWWDPFAG